MEEKEIRQIVKEEIAPLSERMEKFDARMEKFDARMENFASRMDTFDVKMDTFDSKLAKVEVSIDHDIKPKLDLILEMLVPVAQKVKEVDRIPAIEEDISVLKASVRYLSDELKKLKQA